jgi:hypothetical protein
MTIDEDSWQEVHGMSSPKRAVASKHPLAEIEVDYVQKTCRVVSEGEVLGMGMCRSEAWEDAARNVLRPPVPPRVQHGSPTMSLKSDEQFWKKERRS